MMKTILYLDQMYVSNMAKALYLDNFKDPFADDYIELYNLIVEKSRQNKLICPSSHYHRTESEAGSRVRDIVWRVTDFLAGGLRLLDSVILLRMQVFGAAAKFAGKDDPWTPSRSTAFNSDPDGLVSKSNFDQRVMVNLPSSAEWKEFESRMGLLVTKQFATFRQERIENKLSFQEELDFQKRQYAAETLIDPVWSAKRSGLDLNDPMIAFGIHSQQKLLNDVHNILGNSDYAMTEFAVSNELFSIPDIDIRARIATADIVYHPEIIPTGSYQLDLGIVSNFISYVDILTTDSAMKERIRKSGIENSLQTKVLSNRRSDRNALIEIIRSL